MSNRIRCACPRCTVRALMGPAIIITLGVLFLLSEMRGGFFDFSNTYPFLLIVIGVISLASSLAPMDGHISPNAPSVAPASSVPPPGVSQPPMPGQGQ
jgi:hypothetical protein